MLPTKLGSFGQAVSESKNFGNVIDYIHFDPQIKSNQKVLFKVGTFYNSTT
jgi:hypothetical protein